MSAAQLFRRAVHFFSFARPDTVVAAKCKQVAIDAIVESVTLLPLRLRLLKFKRRFSEVMLVTTSIA
jgi:hypothetical protein